MFNKQNGFILLIILIDCFMFLLSFVVAFVFKFYVFATSVVHYSFTNYLIYALCLIPIWILFVNFFVGYRLFYISFFNLFIKIFKATTAFIIFLFALIFIIKSDTSRLFLFFSWINLMVITFIFRYILKKTIAYTIYKLNIRTNLLVVGKKVRRFKKIFKNDHINKVYYYPYLLDTNNIEKLKFLSVKKSIKEIIIVNYLIKDEEFLSLCDWAQINNIDIKILPNEVQMTKDKIILDETLGIPIILLVYNPVRTVDYFTKRLMDIVISFILLIILSPVFVIIAILIKLESKGPVFFKQTRIGYNQKIFSCYKFRSMCNNAEKELNKLKTNNKQIFFKIEDDPRITKIGKFIRKYSLDELPQLFNVLKGEMSLVGPRPMLESETKIIEKNYHNYSYKKLFKVLPGISGLWQVSGRSMLSDEKKIELEIFYVDNWSLALDIKILLKTILVVVFHKGAY